MATNKDSGPNNILLPVPTGTVSGAPVISRGISAVAIEDEGNRTTGYATCQTEGLWTLSVAAVDDEGNTTIAVGDVIYYDAANTPVLSKRTSGQAYGLAQAAVAVGATATISVILVQSLGGGVVAGSVGTYSLFETNPITAKIGGGAAGGTAGDENVMVIDGNSFEYHIAGTQTITAPSLVAGGLNIGMDQTADDGMEMGRGITVRNPEAFTVGTSPAFYARLEITIATVAGTDDCAFGFRKQEAYNAIDSYNDFACLNVIAGDIYIESNLNGAGTVATDTTDDFADAETHTIEVYVSAAGVVTYMIDGVAPTATAAFTFDDSDVVQPFFYFLNHTGGAGVVALSKWETGLQ